MSRILVHAGTVQLSRLLDQVVACLIVDQPVYVLYVTDTQPLEEVHRAIHGLSGIGPHRHRVKKMDAAVYRSVQEVSDEVAAWASDRNIAVEFMVRAGRTEQIIVETARQLGVMTIVMTPASSESGPGSVGHLVHFVSDHAPCSVWIGRLFEGS